MQRFDQALAAVIDGQEVFETALLEQAALWIAYLRGQLQFFRMFHHFRRATQAARWLAVPDSEKKIRGLDDLYAGIVVAFRIDQRAVDDAVRPVVRATLRLADESQRFVPFSFEKISLRIDKIPDESFGELNPAR